MRIFAFSLREENVDVRMNFRVENEPKVFLSFDLFAFGFDLIDFGLFDAIRFSETEKKLSRSFYVERENFSRMASIRLICSLYFERIRSSSFLKY